MERPPESPPAPGTEELQALAPMIAVAQLRRRRFLIACATTVALGLVLIAIGAGIARSRGLDVVAREEATTERDPDTGVRIGMEARSLDSPAASEAVLMVHGWCSGPTDFADLPELLRAEGFHVRVMRLPGHGTTPSDFAASGADDWRAAVRTEHDALAARFARVHAVGFSMGGALLTELAAERDLGRVALLAPFFGLPYPQPFGLSVGSLAESLGGLIPFIDSGPEVNTLRCRELADRFKKYRALPLSAVAEADRVGRAASDAALLERVTEPLLFVAAPDDPVASADRALAALARTSSVEPSSFVAEDSEHILCFDCDADAVKAAVVEFLARR